MSMPLFSPESQEYFEKIYRDAPISDEADSLNSLSAPLNEREKLLAMTDAEFELYE
jgi:hypothetical protein